MTQAVAEEVSHQSLKERLAQVHRIITAGGLWPLTKGHVSARDPEGRGVFVLSHIHAHGRTLDTTTPDDMCLVDWGGNQLDGTIEPVGELFMHTSILGQRSDVNSVVHCHSTYATALSAADVRILPIGRRGAPFFPDVPILDLDRQIETAERGKMLVDAMGEGCALVLKNHGTVVAADTVEHACMLAFALEETAKMHWIASCCGRPVGMSREEAISTMSGHRREEFYDHVWQHYLAMDPAKAQGRQG